MIKSNWERDLINENELAKYLDRVIYPILIQKNVIRDFQRNNINGDDRGNDIRIIFNNGEEFVCDEKATLNYCAQKFENLLPTFAIELQNTTSGKEGWLFDKNKINDMYILIWPLVGDEEKRNKKIYEDSDFTGVEILFVKKDNLLKLLNYFNIDNSKIQNWINKYKHSKKPVSEWAEDGKNYKVSFSPHLYEKPMNLVLFKKKELYYCSKHEDIFYSFKISKNKNGQYTFVNDIDFQYFNGYFKK